MARRPAGASRAPRAQRTQSGALFIEGVHGVEELLAADAAVRRLYVNADARTDGGTLEALVKRATQRSIPISYVEKSWLEQHSDRGMHQNVIAELPAFSYTPWQSFAKAQDEPSLILVCDHIVDSGNLGAAIRSADGVGASGLIIEKRRSASVNAVTFSSSSGAVAHVPIDQVANLVQTLDALKDAGYWVIGASEHASDMMWDVDLRGNVALVVGNEAQGLSELVRKHCDMLAKLPMRGRVGSLNVSCAASVCMYEWLRQNEGRIV